MRTSTTGLPVEIILSSNSRWPPGTPVRPREEHDGVGLYRSRNRIRKAARIIRLDVASLFDNDPRLQACVNPDSGQHGHHIRALAGSGPRTEHVCAVGGERTDE